MKKSALLISLISLFFVTGCVSAKLPYGGPDNDISWEDVPSDFIDWKADTDYGHLDKFTYYSSVTKCERPCVVWKPGDYDPSKKYPVLYLLHGCNGEECQWLTGTSALNILGNAIHDGIVKEMIVVMPNTRASEGNWRPYSIMGYVSKENYDAFNNFEKDLTECLMPYISKHYSVATDRKNSAIAGFSLGGRTALFITLKHPEIFGALGAFSPAQGVCPVFCFPKEYTLLKKSDMKYPEGLVPEPLMITVGEKDNLVFNAPRTYAEVFDDNKVEHLYYDMPGGHDCGVWNNNFYQFLKRIFKS